MKKTYQPKRGRHAYKKRHYKRKYSVGAKNAYRQQESQRGYVKKKYSAVFPISVAAGESIAQFTISHFGGINSLDGPSTKTYTIGDVNPQNVTTADMKNYQYFRITGVSYKLIFPPGTEASATALSWEMAYSPSDIIFPQLSLDKLRALTSYNTGGCSNKYPISRFFSCSPAMKALGIYWSNTDQFPSFKLATELYGGQLPKNFGASSNIKITRAQGTAAFQTTNQLCTLQLTYYVQYKGTKGDSNLVTG